MRSFFLRLVALVCLMGFSHMVVATESIRLSPHNVVEVYDGDTFKIELPGMLGVFGDQLPVRINGIDTPEIRSSCSTDVLRVAERHKGGLSRDFLLGAIRGSNKVELHNLSRDKYFRLLADVYIDDVNVADVMVERKLAVPYDGGTKPSWCGK